MLTTLDWMHLGPAMACLRGAVSKLLQLVRGRLWSVFMKEGREHEVSVFPPSPASV